MLKMSLSASINFNLKKDYKLKWAKLKSLLQDKTSLESSLKLLKKQTIEQFAVKLAEIYQDKLEIHSLMNKNGKLFLFFKKDKKETYSKINVKTEVSDLCADSSLQDFLFYFRENNNEMLKIIKNLKEEQKKPFAYFLCHFFYENFFVESPDQEEILYIIYLLLEIEIDNLISPSVESFLNNSFLSEFLSELRNKYEIKNYIDIALNSLIRELDELNFEYNSLDIVNNSKIHLKNYEELGIQNLFFNMEKQMFYINKAFSTELSFVSNRSIRKSTTLNRSNSKYIKNKIFAITNEEIKEEKIPINSYLADDFFNENDLKELYRKENDECMKCFFIRHLRKMKIIKDSNLYNCHHYYFDWMIPCELISKTSINQYNKGYKVIKEFIGKLLDNLSKINLIPYGIKAICKMIYILIKKKFKKISKMEINILICRFLFDMLFFPIFENPDNSSVEKKKMISLDSRKALIDICTVLKKLARGELFDKENNGSFNIFNTFIIESYRKLKTIIDNIITNVKIPERLLVLSKDFYAKEDFSLENFNRSQSETKYEYFDENPHDFMQHKSICFNVEQLFIFFDIVDNNKNLFFEKSSTFEKIYNKLSIYIPYIKKENQTYYVIIDENYNDDYKELLYHEEKIIGLDKSKKSGSLFTKLKFCITYLLSKMEVPNAVWVKDSYDTLTTFKRIHKYLTKYERKKFLPLSWYSHFILDNLKVIDEKYKIKDYNPLYDEINDDITNLLKKQIKLNEFLTVNITTKFFLIENRKNNYKKELENIKKVELNIKAFLFIESADIEICIINGEQHGQLEKIIVDKTNRPANRNNYVICSSLYCCHNNLKEEEINILKRNGHIAQCHCIKIKDFANIFCRFHKEITEEMLNLTLIQDNQNNNSLKEQKAYNLNDKSKIITYSPKQILDVYMNYISYKILGFQLYDSDYIEINKSEEDKKSKDKIIKIIWNYILKSLYIKIFDLPPLVIDETFHLKCFTLSSFIKPSHLKIVNELCDKRISSKLQEHLRNMDNKRTPDGIYEEFRIVMQLIYALYKFFLKQNKVEKKELQNLIIYNIINAKPQRMIFNINFSKVFFDENEVLGNISYKMTEIGKAIDSIQKLDGSNLGISSEEYNAIISQVKFNKK